MLFVILSWNLDICSQVTGSGFYCCCCLFPLGVMYMCLVLSSMSGCLNPYMLFVSYETIDDFMVYCLGATLCWYVNIMLDMVSTTRDNATSKPRYLRFVGLDVCSEIARFCWLSWDNKALRTGSGSMQ